MSTVMQHMCEMLLPSVLGLEALGFESCQSQEEIVHQEAMYGEKIALFTSRQE